LIRYGIIVSDVAVLNKHLWCGLDTRVVAYLKLRLDCRTVAHTKNRVDIAKATGALDAKLVICS
jgi:hypothetical protein